MMIGPASKIDEDGVEDKSEQEVPDDIKIESDSDTDTEDSESQDEDEDIRKKHIYQENYWPSKPEKPKGFTFKGKHKLMTFAVNKSKLLLKRGSNAEIGTTKFNIKDNRKVGGATQVVIEIIDKEGKGNVIVDFWGPNKRKECTVLVKKSKEHDERFVEIAAKRIVQPILDSFISGCDPTSIFKHSNLKQKSQPKTKKRMKCQFCEKSFVSEKYLKVHITKIHEEGQNNCTHCDYTVKSKKELKTHILSKHTELIKKDEANLEGSEKVSFEEKRIDDTLMDTSDVKQDTPEELIERSKFRDEQIKEKERRIEKEEQKYNEEKRRREENLEIERKKTLSRRRKKKKTSSPSVPKNEQSHLPPNIQPVPENVKHLVKPDDYMLCVNSDGACGFNSTAGHILEDPGQGPKLRRVINRHICDRWEYYQQKYEFPYNRQVGDKGEWVGFENSKELLEFLQNNSKADFLWTDSQELHAVSNLYKVDIRIITTRGPDDKNPTINQICPDPELEKFALLPSGTVPDMTLIHFENNHFNLIISSKSRQFTNEVTKNPNEDTSNKELQELKKKYENLKAVHDNCQEELRKLRQYIEENRQEALEENDAVMDVPDQSDEEALVAMKENGFMRTGPQSQSIQRNKGKSFSCQICKNVFKSESTLNKHTEKHNTDGDWNCKKCSFQTNSESSLKKHEKAAKHESITTVLNGIKCNLCEQSFPNENDIVIHKRNDHRSFRPCKNLPNCPYGTDCMFNHQIKTNKFTCYECGEEFETLNNLMGHRRNNHTMRTCDRFLRNECKYKFCWFPHDKKVPSINTESKEDKKESNEAFQPPVFWERTENLAPPATIPNQATWLKMVSMMAELNKMMTEIKNQNKFQLPQ